MKDLRGLEAKSASQVEFAELEKELKEVSMRQRTMDRTAYERAEHSYLLSVQGKLAHKRISRGPRDRPTVGS